ncbi:hypothetical protein [Kutzneria sp. NPDC051319]|uniref:hypothetical protein n=1 Tax=Kutzneria sp. NPDC051319 TaxID=3155047 RepID=UPI00341C2D27
MNVDTAAFFRASNVEPVVRLLAAARRAGCDRSALLGSFYATLHREHPEAHVHEGSPYIHSRIEQASWARSAAGDAMSLAVLELPYVLGHTPGRWSVLAHTWRRWPKARTLRCFRAARRWRRCPKWPMPRWPR